MILTTSQPASDEKQGLPDEIADGLQLADALTALHAAFPILKVKHDPQLQVVHGENDFPLAHLNLDLVVAIQVEFHQDLFDEGLVRNAIPQLHHFPVIFLAVKKLVKEVGLLLLGHIDHR